MRLKTVAFRVCDSGIECQPVNNPAQVADILHTIFQNLDAGQEHFVMLSLNAENAIIGYKVIASGGMTASIVDPRLVFRAALALDAAAIIVAHNHPSGNTQPSSEDLTVTHRLMSAGEIIDSKVIDHLILNDSGEYLSFKEEELI